MSDKIAEIRITIAVNPKQIADRILSGEVTSDSYFVSEEDHLRIASLLDTAHKENQKLRAEVERLLTTIVQIERMAARPLCSKEAIHSVALGALNAWRNPKLVSDPMRKALEGAP